MKGKQRRRRYDLLPRLLASTYISLQLFSALSDTLHNHLRQVNSEKTRLTEEAQKIITTTKQMEASLDDERQNGGYDLETTGLSVTYPLNQCLRDLKEKYNAVSRLHRERFEQVKKLVQALESYSSHLESSFIKIKLPPTSSSTCPPNFDLSPRYVTTLDEEFTRVYDEYNKRVQMVQSTGEDIVRLYSDLGIPQAQTDSAIVKHYRDSPEQLGLHQPDLDRLRSKHDKLIEEKRSREKRIKELKSTVEGLWNRLGVEEPDRRAFLAANRGCGLRTINEFEEELSRLNELKRQNLHLFVEDARVRLQELWDALFFCEEEMLDFTPAFSDVYSDALLSAHEAEIERLQALQEQRAPILAVIEKHRSLIGDREALAASANDSSRLMGKGAKGEKRDPTRLLREEKMRKRIAKDLPKVTAELQKTLERYEDEYGRPFLVHGERYLDEIAAAEAKAPPPRSKTPNGLPPRSKTPSIPSAPPSRAPSAVPTNSIARARGGAALHSATKTPTNAPNTASTLRHNPFTSSTQSTSSHVRSPSKIPARAPLSNLQHGGNSPERRTNLPQYSGPQNRTQDAARTIGKMGPPRVLPPKMRELNVEESPRHDYGHAPPPRPGSVQSNSTSGPSNPNGGYVRPMSPEDVYDDRERMSYMSASLSNRDRAMMGHQDDFQSSVIRHGGIHPLHNAPPPANRQISNTSSNLTTGTTASGSENWETYSDHSQIEPESDARDVYYAKVRAANPSKRPGEGYGMMVPPPKMRMVNQESVMERGVGRGIRIEGSDAAWTDDSGSY
jgi:Ase1/PRC1/MAP65 family protein